MKLPTAALIVTCGVAAAITVQRPAMSQAGSRSDSASMLEVLRPGSQTGQQGPRQLTASSRFCVTGTGWVQREGGPKQEIHAGDVIWTPPGVKHWHGATADSPMSHVAIVEALKGSQANWLEQVSERTYRQ